MSKSKINKGKWCNNSTLDFRLLQNLGGLFSKWVCASCIEGKLTEGLQNIHNEVLTISYSYKAHLHVSICNGFVKGHSVQMENSMELYELIAKTHSMFSSYHIG